jgi:hypothetical protein
MIRYAMIQEWDDIQNKVLTITIPKTTHEKLVRQRERGPRKLHGTGIG